MAQEKFKVGQFIRWVRNYSDYCDGWNVFGNIFEVVSTERDGETFTFYKVLSYDDGAVSGTVSHATAEKEFTLLSNQEGINAARMAIFRIESEEKKSILSLELKIQELKMKTSNKIQNIKSTIPE